MCPSWPDNSHPDGGADPPAPRRHLSLPPHGRHARGYRRPVWVGPAWGARDLRQVHQVPLVDYLNRILDFNLSYISI